MTKEQRAHEIAIAALPIACDLLLKNGAPANSIDPVAEYKKLYQTAMDDSQIIKISQ